MYKPKDNHLRAKEALTLDDAIQRCVNHALPQKTHQGFKLQRAWEAVAAPQIKKHVCKIMFSKHKEHTKNKQKRTVIVYVESSPWAAELRMQQEYYRLRLEHELGEPLNEVKFLVSRLK
ncbi:MAG: DUF721 domain-containing protein [Coriobacteriales bacterium]|jgi:hypothetical protein|nr:DUF721 domain-containing protein [Coriobacteriales bacterium]